MNKRRQKASLAAAAVLILLFAGFCGGLFFLESAVLYPEEGASGHPSGMLTRDGIRYFPRQDITTLLILGIDETGPVRDSLSYNNEGEADLALLAVFDERLEACTLLALNRDTMLEIPVLGLGGKLAGTRYAQLALAHTYGSGLEDSCENTRKAVSRFLMDISIDYYIALNLDAIAILNDAVGGVRVEVAEDFSLVDETIRKGTMTLWGEQARTFVQTRQNVGDHLNLSRMERQREYMQGFVTALRRTMAEQEGFLPSLYQAVAPYIVSDLPFRSLESMMNRYGGYELGAILSPEGENVLGEEYYEFYPDPELLEALILQIFYTPQY